MKSLRLLIFCSIFSLTIASCGGGGGGGSSESSGNGLTYRGLSSQAIITDDNANELSTSSLTVGMTSSSPTSVARSIESDNYNQDVIIEPTPVLTITSIFEIAEEQILNTDFSINKSRSVISVTETIQGSCGGKADFSVEANDSTGVFSGSFNFKNYCDMGSSVNGSVTINGRIDTYTEEISEISMNFGNIETVDNFESISMSGSIDMNVNYDSIDATMNAVVKDNISNKTFKVQDYFFHIEENFSQLSLEIGGRFYHPDYGYVVLSTPSTIQMGLYDEVPNSGQILLTGSDLTSARLIISNSEFYEVEADLDGNGSYESSSGAMAWSDI